MTNEEAIRRLENISSHAVHTIKEESFIMSIDDGIAIKMAIKALETVSCIKEKCAYCPHCENCDVDDETLEIKALEQQPCEMTVNEYRNRLMDAFHNADCGELIAVVVRPEESEFKQLEWLLKNHYHNQKQKPCEDVVSRQAVHDLIAELLSDYLHDEDREKIEKLDVKIEDLEPVTPKEKTGKWIRTTDKSGHLVWECDKCGWQQRFNTNFCPNCGARMVGDTDGNS